MATFVATITFTDQGLKSIRETTRRAASFKAAVKKDGREGGERLLELRTLRWTADV